MRCPRCQHENRPQATFCEACAGPFIGTSPTAQSDADPKSEVEHLRLALTEALEQQTATAEILRVISSSPTDVQPVLDTIADRAMRLCEAAQGLVVTFDGELVHLGALANFDARGTEAMRGTFPIRPNRGSALGRAIVTRAVVHIPSFVEDPEYAYGELSRLTGFKGGVAVPMFREGTVIGVVAVTRLEPGPFSERQIALLQTFADQAVIAIENVRLFNETNDFVGDLAMTCPLPERE